MNKRVMSKESQEVIVDFMKTHDYFSSCWMDIQKPQSLMFSSNLFCGSTIKALMNIGFVCIVESSYFQDGVMPYEVVLIVSE